MRWAHGRDADAASALTWYDILGISLGAASEEDKWAAQAKARVLRPEAISGAPSKVVAGSSHPSTEWPECWSPSWCGSSTPASPRARCCTRPRWPGGGVAACRRRRQDHKYGAPV